MFSIITRANLIHCFTAENAFLKVDWLPIPELRFNQSCTLNTCTGTSSKEIDKVAAGICARALKGPRGRAPPPPALREAGFSCGGREGGEFDGEMKDLRL